MCDHTRSYICFCDIRHLIAAMQMHCSFSFTILGAAQQSALKQSTDVFAGHQSHACGPIPLLLSFSLLPLCRRVEIISFQHIFQGLFSLFTAFFPVKGKQWRQPLADRPDLASHPQAVQPLLLQSPQAPLPDQNRSPVRVHHLA